MTKFWKVALGVWGAIWAAVLFFSTIPAQTAVSNLKSWADLFGLTFAANFVASGEADKAARAIALLCILGPIIFIRWLRFFYPISKLK